MKAKLHIPIESIKGFEIEMFAYADVEVEGTKEEIYAQYQELKNILKGGEGLNQLEWAKFRKEFMLSEGRNQRIEEHNKLASWQSFVLHQMELTIKSINEVDEV